ncbi:hypothetical protein SAMN02745221_01233 [Thermosyntropha lipolytica DSM 11003]|uniref:Uncharacterized protein n=1 Tax=Thermosyntropha lipolytica DSM 11003 TaxID=1123382 RepID=A0A1M5NKH7_9FIRM|nr:hypothetical protein [Thermosyntropha lipolytica]SHG90021.1 hypothetical protein SAMN02745221_01233 [Thermosyntropha lipolytica DSM 11003]
MSIKLKKVISLFIFFWFVFSFFMSQSALGISDNDSKKAIIIVMDFIDVADLIEADTPNLDKLLEESALGLMNVRAKNRNPSSSYMSIGSGLKIGTVPNAELSFNSNEDITVLPYVFARQNATVKAQNLYAVFTGQTPPPEGVVNIYIEMLKNTSSKYKPPYEPGQIGKIARENGLTVAVVGNADTISILNRNIALLAMDENGKVPLGNVSQDLIQVNPLVLGGVETDHQAMLSYIKRYLPLSDILFIDLGDTSRVEIDSINAAPDIIKKQRQQALERDDRLLGQILSLLNLDQTMLIIMSPNPHKQMIEEGNLGLTPIIVHYPEGQKGLLSSPTTRREGIVAGADIIPSIFAYFDSQIIPDNQGMQVIKQSSTLEDLKNQLDFFKNLRAHRLPLNITFMVWAVILILWGFIMVINKKESLYPWLEKIIFATLSIPVVFLFISFTGYQSLFISIILTLALAWLLALAFCQLGTNREQGLFILTSATSLLLIGDILAGSPLMLNSPLGSDVIAGGRFYGIGNDYMGILIASTVVATALAIKRLKPKSRLNIILASLPLFIASIAIGYPKLGANVGGFIASLFTWGVFILVMTQDKLNIKKISAAALLSVLVVIAIASLDAFLNPNPSHAGKAIQNLLAGGSQAFFSIIRIKLGIVANTISQSVWTLVLLLEILILIWVQIRKKDIIKSIKKEYPYISKTINILITAAIVVFAVNDTGVIAASFILLYAIALYWLTLIKIDQVKSYAN